MRKNKYFCVWLTVALALLLATCTYDEWQNSKQESLENAISVADAKTFFEEQMMQMGETRSINELRSFATNFTPQWNRAVINGRDNMVSVDVPIITDIMFKAVIPVKEASNTRWVSVEMPQKLIVVKDLRTDNMGAYVVSIIPDKAYAQSKKELNAMDFTNYGDYGNFSGRIIYSLPLSPVPLRINCYKDGMLTDEATFFGSWNNPEEIQATKLKIKELMSGVSLKRMLRIGLRASGDDTDMLYGGELPEVIITPGDSGDGDDNDNYWGDDYPLGDNNNGNNNGNNDNNGNNGSNSPDPGAGGSTTPGNNSGNQPSQPAPRIDCPPNASSNSTGTINALNTNYQNSTYPQVQPLINQLKQYTSGYNIEYGLAVQYVEGQYYPLNQGDDPITPWFIVEGKPNKVSVYVSENTYLVAHTHPMGAPLAPSPQDAVSLASAFFDGAPDIKANVVFSSYGGSSMVYIDNPTLLTMFYNNGSNDFFETSNGNFKTGSIWDTDYRTVYFDLLGRGYSVDNAQLYALSYVLDKYNTGLKVYEMKNENYKELKTDSITSADGSSTNYSPQICQ